MRGAVSGRDLIIFLTFAVIFTTLVVQGLSLPAMIRRLGITRDGQEENEEVHARLVATKAALRRSTSSPTEDWTRDDTIERMRARYEYRKRRFAARAGRSRTTATRTARSPTSRSCRACWRHSAMRSCDLRNDGDISNEVMNRVIRELDLEESRLEI